jgi:hypothetical protein
VTDPSAELSHAVLMKVGEFIRKLPADQLAELARGEAKLELVPKGGRTTTPRRTTTPKPLTVPVDEVREQLGASRDPAASAGYLNGLNYTADQLRTLATELGIPLPSKATKPRIVDTIVEWKVSRRLDSEAISRPGPARF